MLLFSSKKQNYNTKISKIEIKIADHDHEKYITLQNLISYQQKIKARKFSKQK